jgi:hypothetical protein
MATGGVIFVSDKQARLKPCLRCGYSLRHIAGAKNCPECGLAVRISFSSNSGLEWTNPRWQRFLAFGFGVLAIGQLCTLLSSATYWILYGADDDYYQLGDVTFQLLYRLNDYAGQSAPIICGVALCFLSKGEQRYPDRSRLSRALRLSAGVLLIVLGSLHAATRHTLWQYRSWVGYILSHALHGPWLPFVMCVLVCAYVIDLGKRSGSRLLSRLSQAPIWSVAAGFVFWLININQFIWPLPLLLLDAAFPLSMIVMLVATIRALLSGAREAELNWVTDP